MYKLLVLCVLFCPLGLFAQENFTERDSIFFQKQLPKMQFSLEKMGLTKERNIRNILIGVRPDMKGVEYVVLMIQIADSDTWRNLRKSYQKTHQRKLEEDIFDKFVFLCEVEPERAVLSIYESTKGYKLQAGLDPDQDFRFDINEDTVKTKAWIYEPFELPKYQIFPAHNLKLERKIPHVKEKMIQVLKEYYENKGSWFSKSNFDTITNHKNFFKVRISNLKMELIRDNYQYFELIEINIKITEKSRQSIHFQCGVDAKYGTSIFIEPRMTDFKDISQDSKYQKFINEYALRIRDHLYEKLR